MKLVNCTPKYWEFVRKLRLDERVIDGFIKTKQITKEEQISYMKNNSKYYRICLINKQAAGYVGVIDNDIRVCTHPDFQGKGIGKFMINESMNIWPTAFAKVKLNNHMSIRLFESCGFARSKNIIKEQQEYIIFIKNII